MLEINFQSTLALCSGSHTPGSLDAIVNISSNNAQQEIPDIFPYNDVKNGIEEITQAIYLDFGLDVRINTISLRRIIVEWIINKMSTKE